MQDIQHNRLALVHAEVDKATKPAGRVRTMDEIVAAVHAEVNLYREKQKLAPWDFSKVDMRRKRMAGPTGLQEDGSFRCLCGCGVALHARLVELGWEYARGHKPNNKPKIGDKVGLAVVTEKAKPAATTFTCERSIAIALDKVRGRFDELTTQVRQLEQAIANARQELVKLAPLLTAMEAYSNEQQEGSDQTNTTEPGSEGSISDSGPTDSSL